MFAKMIRFYVGFLCVIVSSQALAIDFSVIKNAALLSAASYGQPDLIEQRLAKDIKQPYSLVHHNELPNSALRYFLVRSPEGVQFLSFRGTANLDNAMVDLDLSLAADAQLNIQLHQGFALAATAAYNDVHSLLDKSKPVRTTGHSLGGAIAVIMAMYLDKAGYDVDQVITFGQPKVTNVAGANAFSDLPLTRIVTAKDIVPLVPPLSPLQLKNLDIYWHMGVEVILLEDNQYALLSGVKSMMRATEFVSSVPDESNLLAHQMMTYLGLIDDKLNNSQEMPYQVKMSLFGFSFNQ